MSIAELNGPDERGENVLMMARCGGPVDGFLIPGLTNEAEIKVQARRLEAWGLLRIEHKDTDQERIFLTRKGRERSVQPERKAA